MVPLLLMLTLADPGTDEARTTSGRVLRGSLSWKSGRGLQFQPANGGAPLPWRDLVRVRLPGEARPLRSAHVVQVQLSRGQVFLAVPLSLDEKALTCRTTWADRLVVPRDALTAIRWPEGRGLVFVDELRQGLKAWKITGKPETTSVGVQLSTREQSLEWMPARPIPEGRVGLNFRETEPAENLEWLLECDLGTGQQRQTLRLILAGPGKNHTAETTKPRGTSRPVPRGNGWRRAEMRFGPDSLRLAIDGSVLWYDLEAGAGPLSAVRIRPRGQGSKGRVLCAEFSVEAAFPGRRWPVGDAEQDEVRLAGGDQVFGTLLSLDGTGLSLRGEFGRKVYPWTLARGVVFRQGKSAVPAPNGTQVRVGIDAGGEVDELVGVIKGLGSELILRQDQLGEVRLPRSALRWICPAAGE